MPVLPDVASISVSPGLDVAALLGLDDHRQRRPVLDRAGRIVAFELAEDRRWSWRPAAAAGGRAACCRRWIRAWGTWGMARRRAAADRCTGRRHCSRPVANAPGGRCVGCGRSGATSARSLIAGAVSIAGQNGPRRDGRGPSSARRPRSLGRLVRLGLRVGGLGCLGILRRLVLGRFLFLRRLVLGGLVVLGRLVLRGLVGLPRPWQPSSLAALSSFAALSFAALSSLAALSLAALSSFAAGAAAGAAAAPPSPVRPSAGAAAAAARLLPPSPARPSAGAGRRRGRGAAAFAGSALARAPVLPRGAAAAFAGSAFAGAAAPAGSLVAPLSADVALDLVERRVADALDVLDVVDRLERAVRLAVIDDRLRLDRADAVQRLELFLGGRVDVDGRERQPREAGGRRPAAGTVS